MANDPADTGLSEGFKRLQAVLDQVNAQLVLLPPAVTGFSTDLDVTRASEEKLASSVSLSGLSADQLRTALDSLREPPKTLTEAIQREIAARREAAAAFSKQLVSLRDPLAALGKSFLEAHPKLQQLFAGLTGAKAVATAPLQAPVQAAQAAASVGTAPLGAIDAVMNALNTLVGPLVSATQQMSSFVAATNPAAAEQASLSLRELQATIGVGLEPVLAVFSDLVRDVAGALQPLMQQLAPVLAQMGEILASLLVPVIQVIADVFTQLKPAIDQLLEAVTPLIEPITRLISQIADALVPIFEVFVEILTALMPVVEVILEIFNALAPILKIFADLIKVVFDALKPILDILTPIFKALAQVIKAVTLAIAKAVDAITRIATLGFGGTNLAERIENAGRRERPQRTANAAGQQAQVTTFEQISQNALVGSFKATGTERTNELLGEGNRLLTGIERNTRRGSSGSPPGEVPEGWRWESSGRIGSRGAFTTEAGGRRVAIFV